MADTARQCIGAGFASVVSADGGVTSGTAIGGGGASWHYPEETDDTAIGGGVAAVDHEPLQVAAGGGVASVVSINGGASVGVAIGGGVASAQSYNGDPTQEGYELFVADVGSPFDFTTPDETFTSFPYTSTLALSAGATKKVAIRRRNQWGYSSRNVDFKTLVRDGAGDPSAANPSPPDLVIIEQVAGNKGRLRAYYYPRRDGALAATHFVYAIDDGLGFPADTVVAMLNIGNVRILDITTSPHPDATVLTANVFTRRTVGGDDFDSTAVQDVATISTDGPAAPGGGSAEYVQQEERYA